VEEVRVEGSGAIVDVGTAGNRKKNYDKFDEVTQVYMHFYSKHINDWCTITTTHVHHSVSKLSRKIITHTS